MLLREVTNIEHTPTLSLLWSEHSDIKSVTSSSETYSRQRPARVPTGTAHEKTAIYLGTYTPSQISLYPCSYRCYCLSTHRNIELRNRYKGYFLLAEKREDKPDIPEEYRANNHIYGHMPCVVHIHRRSREEPTRRIQPLISSCHNYADTGGGTPVHFLQGKGASQH